VREQLYVFEYGGQTAHSRPILRRERDVREQSLGDELATLTYVDVARAHAHSPCGRVAARGKLLKKRGRIRRPRKIEALPEWDPEVGGGFRS
jgi:hypothetical protein